MISGLFISLQVSAEAMSLKDLVNLLILVEAIPKDKIAAANQFLINLEKQNQNGLTDEENIINLTSEQTATSTYTYSLHVDSVIDRLALLINCDKSKVSVRAKGGWTCGDKLTFAFMQTKNFTFPNVKLALDPGVTEPQKIEVTVIGYLNDNEIGRDIDIVTIK